MYFLWAAAELVIASVGNAAQLPGFAGLPSAETAAEATALRFSTGEAPSTFNAPSSQRRQWVS